MNFQKFIKKIIVTSVALYGVTATIPGFSFDLSPANLLIITLTLLLLQFLAKPIIKLLLLPLNLVTLGAFRWLINLIIFYLLDTILIQLNIISFSLDGIWAIGTLMPQVQTGKFFALLISIITFRIFYRLARWVIH